MAFGHSMSVSINTSSSPDSLIKSWSACTGLEYVDQVSQVCTPRGLCAGNKMFLSVDVGSLLFLQEK